jgi:pyridoxal phosphate enzyme (YggS family)
VSGPVAARLDALRRRIDGAARRAGRDPAEVTLVGVSKRVPAERVVEAIAAGLADVGESYVQEAKEKRATVEKALAERGLATPRWHGIGRLQRNKARDAVVVFDALHSLDREDLARELDLRATRAGRRLEVLLQVSLCGEPQKGGAPSEALPALLEACAGLTALEVTGLMTIPAAASDPETARPVFARLRALAAELRAAPGGAGLRKLSMGMSDDFELAIEEGATHVRVGTALFGPREG